MQAVGVLVLVDQHAVESPADPLARAFVLQQPHHFTNRSS